MSTSSSIYPQVPEPRSCVVNEQAIEADFGKENADTFRHAQHPALRAARVSANPKSRRHSAGLLRSEKELLANGPARAGFSNQSGEGDIRKAIIEADLVDCMVALPGQLSGKLRMN
jgi:type I restriction enzyme M protein